MKCWVKATEGWELQPQKWVSLLKNANKTWPCLFYCLIQLLISNGTPSPGRRGGTPTDTISCSSQGFGYQRASPQALTLAMALPSHFTSPLWPLGKSQHFWTLVPAPAHNAFMQLCSVPHSSKLSAKFPSWILSAITYQYHLLSIEKTGPGDWGNLFRAAHVFFSRGHQWSFEYWARTAE